ncbi:MAG: hypothetical protein KatS3mg050_4896 [Litorilinea sp.]|nr:MAG: hypothetical protein KatS3mg050_4896 [Litorilinea sp.]
MGLMVPPSLLLAALIAVGYASLFHLWGGRSVRDLLLYVVAAGVGFALGQLLGLATQVSFFQIGQLHLVEASIGAWLALIGAREVGRKEKE